MASGLSGMPNGRPNPGQILLVIHDFKARSVDEISLSRGDRVELVERDDGFGDGWYLGKHLTSGTTGLFPEVYTKPAPRGIPVVQMKSIPGSPPASLPITGIPVSPHVLVSQPVLSSTKPPDSNHIISTPEAQLAVIPANELSASSPDPAQQPITSNTQSPNPVSFEPEKTDKVDKIEEQAHLNPRNLLPPTNKFQIPQASLDVAPTGALYLESSASPISPLSASDISEDEAQLTAVLSSTTSSMPRNSAVSSVASPQLPGQDSPVMTETLGVIQEHISNMGTSKHDTPRERLGANDSGSEYSSHLDHRMSYINGEETDEEEGTLTAAEVSAWDCNKVADYLASVGVEKKHCNVFQEQEITGDVLLGMEQSSVFLKEFDLGPVGRRLKTWQRIRELQDEVRRSTPTGARSPMQTYGSEVGLEDMGKSRSQTLSGAAILPRIPSVNERPGSGQKTRHSQQQGGRGSAMQSPSPISPGTTSERINPMNDGPRRPSAASVRDLHHSRRHSSNDFNANLIGNRLASSPSSPVKVKAGAVHVKAPSFDKNWMMGGESPSTPTRPLSTGKTALLDPDDDEQSSEVNVTSPWEFERGYFSGGDIEDRTRNLLRKKGTPTHSRNSSYADEQRIRTATSNARHSRLGSVDSARDQHVSPASQKYYGVPIRRKTSSANSIMGAPAMHSAEVSPTVTKLDGAKSPVDSPRSPEKSNGPGWAQASNGVTSARGSRAVSDTITGIEKAPIISPPDQLFSSLKEESLDSPSRTDSTTSGGPSFEIDSPSSAKAPSSVTTPGSKTSRKKSKKETSAYTRGLEKKTPQEQLVGCDYSGWMKKKSTNLMTTWKPRLFILRGRRLSYYYSEDDDQEQGLIDISFHRVLPAENDRITGLHATLTGATTSPTTPVNSHTETNAAKDAAAEPQSTLSKGQGEQIFIFKLVPPRAGLSRAVNFTKPTVHYFAVPNVTEGRLWMAALMKATIDRDDSKPITTTYQQKTISLAKARAMRHRPPALMNLDEKVEDEPKKSPQPDDGGLNIRGIIFDKESREGDSAVSVATKEDSVATSKTSSFQGTLGGLKSPEVSETFGNDEKSPSTILKSWMRFPRSTEMSMRHVQ